MSAERKAVLIATLGTEPQVLTLCLQELLARGERIAEAVGVHSRGADPAIAGALERLRTEWPSLPFGSRVALRLEEIPAADFDSERALSVLYRHLKDLVASYRKRGFKVHLNLSGGRKPMGICALMVAQLLFGPEDRLWYLISSPELVASRALVGDRRAYRLVEIPVPLWTEAGVFLEVLARYEDPWAAVELQRRLKHREELERWRHFLDDILTSAERRVVAELVIRGGTNADIARRLRKSPRTVEHQLESAYRKLREFLDWPPDLPINRTTLAALLSPFIREIPPREVGKGPEETGEDLLLS
ncbi:CRISPR-associated ring nuclease [Candidatus Bipolaricaulota sp. J31]